MRKPHLELAKKYWKRHLKKDDLAIDATCGNGYDTLFLSEICSVIGLDIQKIAIENTRYLLEAHGKKATLYQVSHEALDQLSFPKAPRLIVYNLGYLPKADKSITTMSETTLISAKKGLALLAPDGALSITCYPGHDEGKREEEALIEWAKELKNAHHFQFNRERAPSLFWIKSEKI